MNHLRKLCWAKEIEHKKYTDSMFLYKIAEFAEVIYKNKDQIINLLFAWNRSIWSNYKGTQENFPGQCKCLHLFASLSPFQLDGINIYQNKLCTKVGWEVLAIETLNQGWTFLQTRCSAQCREQSIRKVEKCLQTRLSTRAKHSCKWDIQSRILCSLGKRTFLTHKDVSDSSKGTDPRTKWILSW